MISASPRHPEIGVLGVVPEAWGPMWQPRHQVMTRLAQTFQVVWLDPGVHWREAGKALMARGPRVAEPIPGFHVYTPEPWLPRFLSFRALDRLLERTHLARARAELVRRGCKTIVLYVWRPEFEPAVDNVRHDLLCYHVDDEYNFSDVDLPTDPREVRLLTRADQVFIHSPALLEKKGHLNPHTRSVPNGVDFALFAAPLAEPDDLAGVPHPRIGYIGYIKRHLDWELIDALAAQHPAWQFVFVGATSPHRELAANLARLAQRDNVHFLGAKSTIAMAHYPQHFDVCVMPYVANGYTKYIYPLKLHEYLATGRPVVGARIRSLEDFSDVIAIASGPAEWSTAIEAALSSDAGSPERVAARRTVAEKHDWGLLVDQIAGAILERLTSARSRR